MQRKNDFRMDDVIAIAREAGAAIMSFRLRPEDIKAQIKGDGTPVSMADKTANDIIVKKLTALTPDIPVVSEEAPEADNRAALAAPKQWICDPLDGTASFLSGHDGFGVHIALVENGVPIRAAIFFPAKDVLYYTDDDGKAWSQKGADEPQLLQIGGSKAQTPLRLAVSWRAKEHPAATHFSYTPYCEVGGGRICAVADGRADAAWMVNPRKGTTPFSCWDVAASHALLRAAGGDLWSWPDGGPVTYRDFGARQAVGCTAETFNAMRPKPSPPQPKIS